MKVKCIKEYNDLQLKRMVTEGEELNVTEERAKVLFGAKVAEKVPTSTTEVVTKKAPAKKKVEG